MHLADHELRELLDGELTEQLAQYANSHLDECDRCAERRRELRTQDEEIERLLVLSCPPVPEVNIDGLIAGSGRGERRRRAMLAAALALAAGTAAAAMPGSPLRVYVERAIRSAPNERKNVGSLPGSTAAQHGTTGIVFRPSKTTEIVFLSRQVSGSARVTFSDAPEVRVMHSGGVVRYRLDGDVLTIDNSGSVADFSLTLPRWLASARIRAGKATLLRATGGSVLSAVNRDVDGAYLIELSTYPKE